MFTEDMTLRQVLACGEIAPIAGCAIKNRDLNEMKEMDMSMKVLSERHFGGDILRGFRRLFRASASGDCLYPLYDEAECAADPDKENTHLLWLPSDDPAADDRPYILIVPGGGFVHVWNLTEGWPIGDHMNAAGYHAFVLTYRVACPEGVAVKEMEDVARALTLIRENAAHFHVRWDNYVIGGFSAGGFITCLWCAGSNGYLKYGMPKPRAAFPVYPFVSPLMADEKEMARELFGCEREEIASLGFEPVLDAKNFPPTAIFVSTADDMVPVAHSRLLEKSLEDAGVPVYMEEREGGFHGFGGGEGMNMEGWIKRMLGWLKTLGRE